MGDGIRALEGETNGSGSGSDQKEVKVDQLEEVEDEENELEHEEEGCECWCGVHVPLCSVLLPPTSLPPSLARKADSPFLPLSVASTTAQQPEGSDGEDAGDLKRKRIATAEAEETVSSLDSSL